jgi:hypothetical protein
VLSMINGALLQLQQLCQQQQRPDDRGMSDA